MRLTDLEPRWLKAPSGERIGFVFRSPTKAEFWQTCFVRPLPLFTCAECEQLEEWCCPHSQMGAVRASGLLEAEDAGNVQGCKKTCAWTVTPPIEEATFDNISVTPSLDGSAGGLWHGFITNGEIR